MALAAQPNVVDRMIRAAKLDATLYEEVEADDQAMGQAMLVVMLAGLLGGLGEGLAKGTGGAIVGGLVGGLLSALIGWWIWAYLTYWIGTSGFGGTATPGEMLRTLGFAQTPRMLLALQFLPVVGPLLQIVGGIWTLVAGVVAVRQALDFSTGKALATVLIGFVVVIVVSVVIGIVVGVLIALLFAGASAVAR